MAIQLKTKNDGGRFEDAVRKAPLVTRRLSLSISSVRLSHIQTHA
jgi:hypothetical protein